MATEATIIVFTERSIIGKKYLYKQLKSKMNIHECVTQFKNNKTLPVH